MHRVHRQLLLAIFSLIILITTCNKCRQRETATHTWTPELEQQMHDVFYTQSARFTTSEAEKNEYSDCCLSKIKELFPNGIASMGADMSDSVKVAIMRMGTECARSFKSLTDPWQPVVVEQLKLTIYSDAVAKLLPQKMKQEYVDCISYKIIGKFPKGLKSSNRDSLKIFMKAERKKCLKLLVNKYGKLKMHSLKQDTIPVR